MKKTLSVKMTNTPVYTADDYYRVCKILAKHIAPKRLIARGGVPMRKMTTKILEGRATLPELSKWHQIAITYVRRK